jgi:hypothetical protein
MSVIKKLIAGISLATLLLSLGGCLPFMAVRAAKAVSDKANSPSDADAKKTQDANKPADPAASPATATPAAAAPAK